MFAFSKVEVLKGISLEVLQSHFFSVQITAGVHYKMLLKRPWDKTKQNNPTKGDMTNTRRVHKSFIREGNSTLKFLSIGTKFNKQTRTTNTQTQQR